MKKLAATIISLVLYGTTEAATFGYTTGNTYMQMDELNQMIWVTGVADGFMSKAFVDNGATDKLMHCMSDMHPIQVHAMFEKELMANPESWSFPVAILLYSALKRHCGT